MFLFFVTTNKQHPSITLRLMSSCVMVLGMRPNQTLWEGSQELAHVTGRSQGTAHALNTYSISFL